MKKKFVTVINGEEKEYDVLLEFTSNDTGKKYVFYYDKENNNIVYAYYKDEGNMYVLTPVENEDEKTMCLNMIEDLKNILK